MLGAGDVDCYNSGGRLELLIFYFDFVAGLCNEIPVASENNVIVRGYVWIGNPDFKILRFPCLDIDVVWSSNK